MSFSPAAIKARNEERLVGLSPTFTLCVRAALAACEAQNNPICIVSGYRSYAEQAADYAQGRNGNSSKIVTEAPPGHSMHNYGLAVDAVPVDTDGSLIWDVKNLAFQHMVAEFKAQGLAWGGDWKGKLGDYDHFQDSNVPASPTFAMLAFYNKGSAALPQIWVHVDAGLFKAVLPLPDAQA